MPEPITFTDGAGYDRSMGVWSELAGRRFLDWLRPASGLRWVDIGCGTGAFSRLLAETCAPADIQGIDPSPAQIAYAASQRYTCPVRFQGGEAMALPFDDHAFDAAVMALVLFFVPNPMRGVAEMRRTVRPGGLICAYVWDIPGQCFPMQAFWDAFRAHGREPAQPPQAPVSALGPLAALWSEAGLREVQTLEIEIERQFDDFQAFWDNAMGLNVVSAGMAGMAPEEAASIQHHIRAALEADAGGPVTIRARANAVRGLT